jgi:hypothetical protein
MDFDLGPSAIIFEERKERIRKKEKGGIAMMMITVKMV